MMKENSALTLRKKYDRKETISKDQALDSLNNSQLVVQLLKTPLKSPNSFTRVRAYVLRLLELSEIPYTYYLE